MVEPVNMAGWRAVASTGATWPRRTGQLGHLKIFKNLIQNKVAKHKSAFFKILIKIKSLESKILVKQRSFQAVFAVQDVVEQTIRHFP